MSYDESLIKNRIRNTLIYNSIIFLIFLFWFFYSTVEDVSILLLMCTLIFLIIFIKFMVERKYGFTTNEKVMYILLFFIPFSLYINIVLFHNASLTIFIPFNNLVGINHNHNFILFLIYFSVILIKLIGIKFYFSRNENILQEGRGDDIFKFFTQNITYKKVILLVILFPLVAFIEELIYRSFLLSVLSYYLNWDYILSILVISIIFGLVHYSTSQNWGHVISTLISSIIYSLALIQLGLLYPWIFHLMTNLTVLLFYSQTMKKRLRQKSSENSMQ
ncbi:MAG: hypothetical protein CEE43_15460 [Promethearchaeota archaeon Loki_b32]|nr:MAG: hypothetical protein CEE43_15460 [Candidatus Lokiarchaeota archaeon Loki_b32]